MTTTFGLGGAVAPLASGAIRGAMGFWARSVPESRSPAAATWGVRAGRPKTLSMRPGIDAVLSAWWSTAPARENGDTSSAGTRRPWVAPPITGGATWSYHPPASSYVIRMAVWLQAGLWRTALTSVRT